VLEEGAGFVGALLVDQPGGEIGLRDGAPVGDAEPVEPVDPPSCFRR
jgi:hypothetical protein